MIFRLDVLGGLTLSGGDAGTAQQRRRLALLALLAVSGERGMSRDQLIGFLWPEAEADAARHSLDQMIYALRRSLGDSVFLGTNPVSLNYEIVESDVADFERSLAARDYSRAVSVYHGPLLNGFFLSESPGFERWADSERMRLSSLYRDALARLADAATKTGDRAAAVRWWRQLAVADPLSAQVAVGLMRALDAVGDGAAALQHARVYENLVRQEVNAEPDPSVVNVANELRGGRRSQESNAPVGNPAMVAATTTASSVAKPQGRPWKRISALGSFAAAILLVAWFGQVSRNTNARTTATGTLSPAKSILPSIAVLPLENVSHIAANEYFSDGMTEALIDALSRAAGLRVISRTSAFTFRDSKADVREIGKALRVQYLVEGGIQREDSRIRISIRLITAEDGTTRWSQTYDRQVGDLFSIQDEIARSVVRAVTANVAGGSAAHLVRSPPGNLEAYNEYLLGRYQWNLRSTGALESALQHYERAIALDSGYAAAYSGLAETYAFLGDGNYSDYPPQQAYVRARNAALKAVALDDSLSDAHGSLGFIRMLYEYDWAGAEAELNRAVSLDPGNPRARQYRSILYAWTGRNDAAVAEMREALSTDPLSVSVNTETARALFLARQYDAALTQLRAAEGMDSTFSRLHLIRGQLYAQKKMYAQATAEFTYVASLRGRSPRALGLLGNTFAQEGRRADALQIVGELKRRWAKTGAGAFDVAAVYSGLGDSDQAFRWLDRAFDDRSLRPFLFDPTFDSIRADPRFAQLLAKMGLPKNVGARG